MRTPIVCLILLPALAAPLQAATPREAVVDRTIAMLDAVEAYQQVALAPDAAHVAWVVKPSGVFVMPVAGSTPTRVTAQPSAAPRGATPRDVRETEVAWSPDSRELAFVSDAVGNSAQLYVAAADGRSVRPLTALKGALARPRYSPDGKRIAVLLIENAARRGGATVAMTPPSGDVELQIQEQRIAIVDVATHQLSLVTPGDLYVYDYDWSPDGRSFVAEAAHGSGENNYWTAALYRFDIGNPAGRVLHTPTLQLANPRWSPDGTQIAFIGGLMSDEGSNGGDVWVVPAAGGTAVNWTAHVRATTTTLEWLAGSSELLVGENIRGLSGFARVSASGRKPLWNGPELASDGQLIGCSSARDGVTTAVVRESFERPPAIAVGPIGTWKATSHANDAVRPPWGHAESLEWASDSYSVQGWLLLPQAAEGKLPLVVQVHGGPSSAATQSWPSLRTAALVASGYAVLIPNPRGSYGQGEEFVQANVKDFGYGDFRDIQRGVDTAVARADIDANRVGIWGWSYGGYMTMWAVTQTTRFKAAVAGAGIVNWESYYGQNSIDTWMLPFFGASVYDDPWIYRRSAPIEFIKNVKTPTLVMVGDRDGEVPAPQSFEFWHALKARGVETKLVVYANEGHHFQDPENIKDSTRRLVGWFDHFMNRQ